MNSKVDKTGEVDKKVPITQEDIDNVKNYSDNFGAPISSDLQAAMDKFSAEQSYENHIEFKLALCKWLLECGHESFNDSLWDHPKEAARDIVFDLQFDKDVNDVLKEENNDEKADKTPKP